MSLANRVGLDIFATGTTAIRVQAIGARGPRNQGTCGLVTAGGVIIAIWKEANKSRGEQATACGHRFIGDIS